jgi:hypothetical protein
MTADEPTEETDGETEERDAPSRTEGGENGDEVGGGPDRIVSDRSVDDVLATMGGEDGDDTDSTDDSDDVATTETGSTDAERSDLDGAPEPDDHAESEDEPEPGQVPSDLETVAPSEAAVKKPAGETSGGEVSDDGTTAAESSGETPPEDGRDDTPAIDEVDLSMDDVADVSVPDRTPATSDGERASGSDPATESSPAADDGDAAAGESDAEESPGALTRLARWLDRS